MKCSQQHATNMYSCAPATCDEEPTAAQSKQNSHLQPPAVSATCSHHDIAPRAAFCWLSLQSQDTLQVHPHKANITSALANCWSLTRNTYTSARLRIACISRCHAGHNWWHHIQLPQSAGLCNYRCIHRVQSPVGIQHQQTRP